MAMKVKDLHGPSHKVGLFIQRMKSIFLSKLMQRLVRIRLQPAWHTGLKAQVYEIGFCQVVGCGSSVGEPRGSFCTTIGSSVRAANC